MGLADLDGDGDLDAVTIREGLPRVLKNDGIGVFTEQPVSISSIPVFSTSAIALGDVDGDGYVDASGDWVSLNDGTGTLSLSWSLGSDTESIAIGDVDADGDVDWLVGSSQVQDRIYLNDGTSNPPLAAGFPTGMEPTPGVALFDADGDGDLDAYLGNTATNNELLRNDGAGVFTDITGTHLPYEQELVRNVVVGDVDDDGDLDVWLPVTGQNLLQANDGTGHFAFEGWRIPTLVDDTFDGGFADLDGDGSLDLYLAERGEPHRVQRNDGSGVFHGVAGAGPPLSVSTTSVALGDVDGDGDVDALVGAELERDRLFLNLGSGKFADSDGGSPPIETVFAGLWPLRPALGDVDGDGDLDAWLFYDVGDAPPALWLNDGAGGMSVAAAGAFPSGLSPSQILPADVDGDGDLDAILLDGTDGHQLLANDGSGTFAKVPSAFLLIPLDHEHTGTASDLDGDGDVDLHVVDEIYLNDGSGTFSWDNTLFPSGIQLTGGSVAGDMDGDGDPDLVVYKGTFPQQILVLTNDGAAAFSVGTTTSAGVLVRGTTLADVDADGDLDLAVAKDDLANVLWRNDGSGGLSTDPAWMPADAEKSNFVGAADFDEDGDLDLWITNTSTFAYSVGDPARLLKNDGTGVFTTDVDAIPRIETATRAASLGDLDGDGDVDVLQPLQGDVVSVVVNMTRQVTHRRVPSLGKPLPIEIHGATGSPWFLAAALAPASVPIPGFGTLYLDWSQAFLLGGGTVGAGGFSKPTFLVPDNPGLLGTSLFWQTVVGAPLQLSNREETVFTAD